MTRTRARAKTHLHLDGIEFFNCEVRQNCLKDPPHEYIALEIGDVFTAVVAYINEGQAEEIATKLLQVVGERKRRQLAEA